MRVSLDWLNEYVDISGITPEEIAHALTMSGLEVEDIEKLGAKFTNIVVAEIKSLKPHPNADKLKLVTVFNGAEFKEGVCAAQNIKEGQLIPYASVGSKVLDRKTGEQFELKPAAIRGIESQGMLCSQDELGIDDLKLQEEDGILILNRLFDNIKPGQNVKDVLSLQDDIVLNIAPTANRGDEMSVVGVAREVATLFDKPLKFSSMESVNELKSADFKVEIINEETCKYYAIAVLKDLKTGSSPEWMKTRLLASGIRSISNIVDITNYVMLEYGQPLHAFDLNKLNGYLCVRRANEGERLTTLDEEEHKLNKEAVLIATENEGVALAGVMGGFNSEIDDNTTSIALESAYFTPATTRRSARSVGVRTEASARFERGVDIEAVKPALFRATQLLMEICAAKLTGIAEAGDDALPEQSITLRFAQVKRVLGIEIPSSQCIRILESLGFELQGENDIAARVKVPSYRAFDVTREIDLIEEISRIYGYDKITPTLPNKTFASEIKAEDKILEKINKMFLGKGFYQVITSTLIGKPLLNWVGVAYPDEKYVKVTNPQSEEYSMLRQSLIPSVLSIVKHNFDNGTKNLQIYETGKSFSLIDRAAVKTTGVKEKRALAGAITGNIDTGKWQKPEEVDFYTIKGAVEDLFKILNLENRVIYRPCENVSYLHPGRSAEIVILGKELTSLGTFGQIHPNTQDKCKLGQKVFVFEFDLDTILSNIPKSIVRYKELLQYPQVTRDIAFIIPENITHQEVEKAIKKASTNLYKTCDIFDIYKGEHVQKGFKSVAYRITLQDKDATLTDERVDQEIQKIKENLKKTFVGTSFRE
ncbi:MAG: phenylalanine--tRNA ligase subunit beta [Candidatus Gastranaerophilaceae bacterium]|jgi:phenylalanyl-tRNA synthetase beta chain